MVTVAASTGSSAITDARQPGVGRIACALGQSYGDRVSLHLRERLHWAVTEEQPERNAQRAGVGLGGGAGLEWGLGVVFDRQLQRLGYLAAVDPVGQR
jgi:hypothetical protein